MSDKEDYLTPYRVFFENFAATVNPEDQLPVNIAGYTITESEVTGEVLYWITQYLTEKQCPLTLMTPLRRIILDEVRVASKKYPNEFGFKSDEAVYIALRLMQAVTARVNDVCLRYLDNSKLDSLPPPPPLAQRDLKTVSCATKNSRRVMEDRHVEIGNLEALFGIETTEPTCFYAVYDGHAGSAAATYCAAHLHQYLVESPHFTTDLTRAMRDAFLRTDAEFIRKSNQDRACGGSTAVAVTVRGKRLVAAWAGDSLALLAKRMRLMQLVRPHKPSREDERERIEKSGGTVMYWGTWRVNGQLAVSRAIGDAQYKPYVTAKPEIATVDLDGDEDFVVVACDGLWDFVSEDEVALAVYRQVTTDPDDLKVVTKRLIAQAKRQGSADNISIIVVFLKDPRDIAAENRAPMDLGLDNALANAPPFAGETEACKRPDAAAAAVDDADADGETNNGVDNSDSDSEDLGPETAVDADDIDADARNHEPAPPTPPAHAVEDGHVEGALVDNVAESGDDSEDEWNYFKGEGEREDLNPSEEPDEAPTSETPCQDNSAWETSSVDMNSSPLNPDAPVFIPGSVGSSDVLLAESPRKPLPMDDIELPDVAQFETEAVVRPAELLDLDNCDQLNGHHNASIEIKEHLNGNDKCNMDSLGFGFNVGIEPDKVKDSSIIQDFERIQKDTTDFCNIQVFQTHAETNPFAAEGNEELFERLKNKERDPMSMSFYQEKDHDTCERLSRDRVDLNAVQTLPDSDDEELQTNGICQNDKENVSPHTDPFGSREPNNDILRFDELTDNLLDNITSFGQGDNCSDYAPSNEQPFSNIDFEANIPQMVMQTDTPESHKLLFEQIPEIPDGKSSELGFTNDDLLDPSESEKDDRVATPQDISQDDSESREEPVCMASEPFQDNANLLTVDGKPNGPSVPLTPSSPACTPEPVHSERDADIVVHEDAQMQVSSEEKIDEAQHIEERLSPETASAPAESPVPRSPIPGESVKQGIELPNDSPSPQQTLPSESPAPQEFISKSPAPQEVELPSESPLPQEEYPSKSPELHETASPVPQEIDLPRESPAPQEIDLPRESPAPQEMELPRESPMSQEIALPSESPAPQVILLPSESPAPREIGLSIESPMPQEIEIPSESPAPQEIELPSASPLPASPLPKESLPRDSPLPQDLLRDSPLPTETIASPIPTDASLPRDSPLPTQSPFPTLNLQEDAVEPPQELLATDELQTEELICKQHEASFPNSSLPTEVLPTESQSRTDEVRIETPVEAQKTPEPVAQSPIPAEVPSPRVPTPAEAIVDRVEVSETPLAAVEAPVEKSEAPKVSESAPAPDLVPETRELVTDLDASVESRAQEICVPVTSEIRPEDGEKPVDTVTTAASVAAAVGGAIAVGAAAAATTKTPATKKGPTTPLTKTDAKTPKSAPKPAPKTPASATKRPSTAPTRTPLSAPRAPTTRLSATKLADPKPAPVEKTPPPIRAPSKTAAATAKPAPAAPKPAPTAAKPAPTAAKTAPTAAKTAPTAAKPASKATIAARSAAPKPAPARVPATKPAAPKPAAPKPAAPRPPAAKPATAASARPAAPRPPITRPATAPVRKVPEKKPLTNGDVKEVKPRPAPISRPAPRPAPRAAAPAPPATAKSAAPKPATRSVPLDKQSKDLANKRITAKAAPPRTATNKVPSTKTSVSKQPVKKSAEKPPATNGLAGEELAKPPPSPPAHDNSLLPDVIA